MRAKTFIAVACLAVLAGCASMGARLSSKPGAYTVTVQSVHAPHRDIHATYVRPAQERHPGYLVMFVTGDDGWFGTSRAVFTHLADEGYMLAGFSAPEVIDGVDESVRVSTARAAEGLRDVYAQARQHLGVPESTPIVMVGFSRGASAVAFTAVHPDLRDDLKGAVAIALTREADYLHATEDERRQGIRVDGEDRIQLYAALKFLGATPFAVIQSTNDSYVPAAESRQLLGADTATLRLYPVESEDHGFSDARDKLMQDLDDALRWIEEEKVASPST
ncbi:alpha/beta hydrolase family protein [Peristeroidobacter soli]|uniref:alpha/beta hydrolase family protein n=1 Tax=Peristeroidobacter soli TaxID=2497877 RepID=UPI00130029E1|nr:AcvB/VirJ family lysyl-phosphatidylglycerol hydrolase [Peristeroidobacter soli]